MTSAAITTTVINITRFLRTGFPRFFSSFTLSISPLRHPYLVDFLPRKVPFSSWNISIAFLVQCIKNKSVHDLSGDTSFVTAAGVQNAGSRTPFTPPPNFTQNTNHPSTRETATQPHGEGLKSTRQHSLTFSGAYNRHGITVNACLISFVALMRTRGRLHDRWGIAGMLTLQKQNIAFLERKKIFYERETYII